MTKFRTAGHARRVADIAAAIGAELGLDEQRQEGLRIAGLWHDIGKMIIPAEILSTPGKLSALQFKLIQGHAQAGYDVLKGEGFPWPVAQVAHQHHERIDGSGVIYDPQVAAACLKLFRDHGYVIPV